MNQETTVVKSFISEEFGEVRTVIIGGEIWFVVADVCRALEMSNPRKAVSDLPEDEKMTVTNSYGHSGKRGGAQKFNLVNEPGLYRLIFRSRKPEAEKFKRWVFHEVLPSIRKTGKYSVKDHSQEWLRMREKAIKTRNAELFTLKIFFDYAKSQGFDGEEWELICKFTVDANEAVGLPPKGGRDDATFEQLERLEKLECVYNEILTEGMAIGVHYARIIAKMDLWRCSVPMNLK